MEWDNFKEEEKIKSYYEYVKKNTPFFEKLHKELGILTSSWSDGSGHVVYITEYPSAETYAKVVLVQVASPLAQFMYHPELLTRLSLTSSNQHSEAFH